MDADSRPRPNPEARYELIYRLMVIAAIAVIVVSLVGIASLTGLLPRVGVYKPNTEAHQGKERDNARSPAGGRTPDRRPEPQRKSDERGYAVADCAGACDRRTMARLDPRRGIARWT